MKRLILLTVDALGAQHVSCLGYPRQTTPNIDAYAEENTLFETCIAQSSHTRESMFSMFLSAYPFEIGGVGPVPDDRATLATILSQADVTTGGFHSNPYLSRAYDFGQGFDSFYDSLPLGRNRIMAFVHRVLNHFQTQPYTRAEDLNEKGLSWLTGSRSSADESQFLWLHYMDPHGPYQPPKQHQLEFMDETVSERNAKSLWRKSVDSPDELSDKERQKLVNLYDAEIHYVDSAIHDFIKSLKRKGLFDDSIVIVAADHGELFGEYDLYGHPRYVYDELVRVPLLVIGDNVTSRRVNSPVENLDIAPTVMDYFCLEVNREFSGRSLLDYDDDPSRVAYSEASGEGEDADVRRIAVRLGEYHFCAEYREGRLKNKEVFEIVGSDTVRRDPENVDEGVLQDLAERATERATTGSNRQPTAETDSVSSNVEERLRNLGYK